MNASLGGRRVLVTGGAGFIGSHLVRCLLEDGATVGVLEHPNANLDRLGALAHRIALQPADLADHASAARAIEPLDPEFVFHLAGWTGGRGDSEGIDPWLRSLRANLDGVVGLLAALAPRASGIRRIVRTGSMEEYGDGAVPFSETQRERATSPYSASVVAATQTAHALAARWTLPLATVRPSIVYGPGQPPGFFISGLIRACLADDPFPMTSGEQAGDFIFVEDVVTALIAAAVADGAAGEIFNAGSGRAVRVRDLAERIVALSGAGPVLRLGAIPGRAGEASRRFLDTAKAAGQLGWSAATSLDAGLGQTIAWHRAGEPAIEVRHGAR